MNLFVEEMLSNGRFDFRLGTYRIEERLDTSPESIPDSHLRAYRLCRRAAMVIWTLELTRAISLLLNAKGRYSRSEWALERPMWCEIPPEDWEQIRKMMRVIRDHKLWAERNNSEMVSAVASQRQKDWADILLKGRLPGRQESFLQALDQNYIFRASQGMAGIHR